MVVTSFFAQWADCKSQNETQKGPSKQSGVIKRNLLYTEKAVEHENTSKNGVNMLTALISFNRLLTNILDKRKTNKQ